MTTETTTTTTTKTGLKETVYKLFKIDPTLILFRNEENIRNNDFTRDQDYQDLKDSIKVNGVVDPVYVYRINPEENNGFQYKLHHGFRRQNATMELINEKEITDIRIPARVTDKLSELEILLNHLTLNNHKSLSGLEFANVITRLEKFNLTRAEIAQKIGLSQARIGEIIKFGKIVNSDTEIKAIHDTKFVSNHELKKQVENSLDIEETKEVINIAIEQAKNKGKNKVTNKDIQAVKKELNIQDKTTMEKPIETGLSFETITQDFKAEIENSTKKFLAVRLANKFYDGSFTEEEINEKINSFLESLI
jgi:ParB/RepB/Spo0J family partition protein